MYKNFIKKTLFFALLAIVSTAQAFIYKGTIWRKLDAEHGRYHYLYCLSDMHGPGVKDRDSAGLDRKQRPAVANMLRSCNKDTTTKVIVEDLFTASAGEAGISPQVLRPSLLSLVPFCRCYSIDVCNVECRARRGWAASRWQFISEIRELLQLQAEQEGKRHNFSTKVQSLKEQIDRERAHDVRVADILKEFEDAVEQIRSYDDNELLNSYYATTLDRILRTGQKMLEKLQMAKGMLFSDFMDKEISADYQTFCLMSFLLSPFELVDMHALHEIYQAQNKEKTFVIMGGAHVYRVEQILPKMGYELVCTAGADEQLFSFDSYKQYESNMEKIWSQVDINALEEEIQGVSPQQEKLWSSIQPVEDAFFERCLQDDTGGAAEDADSSDGSKR